MTSRRSLAAVLAIALGVGAATTARAEDPQVAALRAEVGQIRAHLEAVEGRLRALEAGSGAVAAPATAPAVAAAPVVAAAAVPVVTPAPVATPAAAPPAVATAGPAPNRAAWRQVREGMAERDVEALLGAPARRFELSGKQVRYYAYPGYGAGSVFFDGSGQVSSVQRPPST